MRLDLNNPTIRQAYNILSQRFEAAQSDAPRLCARVLLQYVLNIDALYMANNPHKIIEFTHWHALQTLAQRHESGEPLAYIVGYKEFFGHKFLLNKSTLIPRPESEDVVEAALDAVKLVSPCFLDIGTGSGCLGISFAAELSGSKGYLVDIQNDALIMARKNAHNVNVLSRLTILQADLRNLPFKPRSFDLIIANPPYVSEQEYATLKPNVRDFEPKLSLVPKVLVDENDPYGLIHIEYIAKQAKALLKSGGVCIVEHGSTQASLVQKIFAKSNAWSSIKTGKDLAGLDRFCLCSL